MPIYLLNNIDFSLIRFYVVQSLEIKLPMSWLERTLMDFIDGNKTLTELEGRDWGPPTFESHLVTTIHRLRYKPLGQFTIEELRIGIGQYVGLKHLIPIAVERLRDVCCAKVTIEAIY